MMSFLPSEGTRDDFKEGVLEYFASEPVMGDDWVVDQRCATVLNPKLLGAPDERQMHTMRVWMVGNSRIQFGSLPNLMCFWITTREFLRYRFHGHIRRPDEHGA